MLSYLFHHARQHPWLVILQAFILFLVMRRHEDTLVTNHGNMGLVGIGIDLLSLARWVGFLSTLVMVCLVQVDIDWREFVATWIRFTNAIVHGARIGIVLGAGGVRLDVHFDRPPEQPLPQENQVPPT